MKNTKIMAALVIFLAAALFVGAASAATAITVSDDQLNPTSITTAGNYTLAYDNATIPGHYLPAGKTAFTTFDGLTPVSGNYTFAAANNGDYQQTVSTNAVTYQLNYVQNASDANQNFVDLGGNVYQRNITANTVATLRFPDTTFIPMGTVFTDGNITQAVTDNAGTFPGYEAGTVLKYTIPASSVTYYLSIEIPVGPSMGPYDRDVASEGDAFVYEHIIVNGTTTSGKLTKFSDGSSPSVVNQISSDANGVFYLTEDVVGNNYGTYYLASTWAEAEAGAAYVNIWYPELSLQAELTTNAATGATAGDSIDGQTVNKDTVVSFLINAPKVGPAYYDPATVTGATAKIVFTTPVSGKTTAFGNANFNNVLLTASQTLAGYTDAGDDAAAGTYTAQAEYVNPDYFADYAEKSNTISFTLQSSTLTITAAQDSVVRSNPFTVTISGKAQTIYAVYLENAMASDVNPTLQSSQTGYQGAFTIDATNGANSAVIGGAFFKTDASGKRTIQYNTAADTEDKTYTVKVNGVVRIDGTSAVLDTSDYDKVKVKVEKGAVTISASGDGSYYIGDEITLSGTNTDSDNVFLFITGQNLLENGIVLKDLPTKTAAYLAGNPVTVKTDNTWEYKWDTSQIALDTGAYTIYATSRLTNGKSSTAVETTSIYGTDGYAVKLSDSEYATVSVNLKQPFLSAVPSATVIAQGDKLYVRGTAEGNPNNLMLYIFGPNFFEDYSITVEDDGTYEKKIDISSSMSSNQYFVVVQHPMYNGVFDAKLGGDGDYQYFYIENSTTGGSQQGSFVVWGANKLQGSQAADALTKMIDDANIDDIYTKLTFTVAAPWIRIENPGDQAVGSTFTISGTTNLAVDDQILVEVMSSSFTAVDKTSTSTTSGVSQTTKVVAGEGTDNVWSVEVDTTNWKLDEYTIKVNGIEVDVTTTTNFNLVEKVVTPTATATATGTTTATATATATATPATPGFGAFVALAGLGAVALLVLRRN